MKKSRQIVICFAVLMILTGAEALLMLVLLKRLKEQREDD